MVLQQVGDYRSRKCEKEDWLCMCISEQYRDKVEVTGFVSGGAMIDNGVKGLP